MIFSNQLIFQNKISNEPVDFKPLSNTLENDKQWNQSDVSTGSTGSIEPEDFWESYNMEPADFEIHPTFMQNKLIFGSGTCRFKFIASALYTIF